MRGAREEAGVAELPAHIEVRRGVQAVRLRLRDGIVAARPFVDLEHALELALRARRLADPEVPIDRVRGQRIQIALLVDAERLLLEVDRSRTSRLARHGDTEPLARLIESHEMLLGGGIGSLDIAEAALASNIEMNPRGGVPPRL